MQYWNITSKLLATIFGLLAYTAGSAQENSPYSRYAMGNLKTTENSMHRGMAGVCMGDDQALVVNPDNPASYSFLKLTSFQLGIEGTSNNIRNSVTATRTGALTISYVNLGLAISKKLGVSFGLMPVTRSKYSMQQTDEIPGISKVINDYYGGGATQKIYAGAAYKVKDFSFGVNAGYLFGNLVNSSDVSFTDTLKILSTSVSSRSVLGGFFIQGGAMMSKKLKDDYRLVFGTSYTLSQKLNAKKDTYWKSFIGDVIEPDFQYNVDSVVEKKGKVIVPAKLAVGVMLHDGDKWKAGIDFNTSNWENYRTYEQQDSTTNSWMIKIGGSITPDPTSVTQTWKRMSYRAGVYSGQDILSFNNTDLKINGFTLGIGYPIRRSGYNQSIGQLNAAIDVGKRGTVNNGLIAEGYTRFSIGFTFNDKWFVKRKYD
ncbi:MAG: hypothetical protein IPI46_06500 [Bacteroidetes bacterium]|nr:hypothetical protein [Bacteroidota bacterium]